MNDSNDSATERSRRELRFFGLMAAGISHELNGVLAMINELAGLLDDRTRAVAAGHPLDAGQTSELAGELGEQVVRGSVLTKRLSWFAHSVDVPIETLDLGAHIERTRDLCQRLASLRCTTLVTKVGSAPATLEGNAFALQHLLFRGFEVCLEWGQGKQPIYIQSDPAPSGHAVHFSAGVASAGPPPDELTRDLAQLADSLGAKLDFSREPGAEPGFHIRLPSKLTYPAAHTEPQEPPGQPR